MTDTETLLTREAWLQVLAEKLRPWFECAGHEVPPPVRIGVGFTSKGARSNRIGECWYAHATGDGVPEVFIHPRLADPVEVAATLAHELVHASLGPEAKHGPAFKRVATDLWLEGRMTATVPGALFRSNIAPVLEDLGPYPHASLNPGGGTTSNGPKQTTRMLKLVCPVDGYTARTTRKWLDVGLPTCPCGTEMLEDV